MIVNFTTKQSIDWEARGIARRIQNINNALNTFRYEVGYDRTFGRDPSLLDMPMDHYIQAIIAETYEIISEVDDKAKILEVSPEPQDSGDLNLRLVIEFE